MNATPTTSCWSTRRNTLLIVVFVMLLWLPTLEGFLHFDHIHAYDEKRVLTKLPTLEPTLWGIRNYTTAWQNYFDDRFGFRARLLHWYNEGNYLVFGNRSGSGVIKGREGWLYYSRENMVDNYRGVSEFTPQQLADWQRLLEHRRDWLAARGIKYLFVIAPDKQTIYPEPLPTWLVKVRPTTKLDEFVAYMKDHSSVEILDLRSNLSAARAVAPTFLKADTHWNLFGGFVGSEEIIRALARQLPTLPPLSLDTFELQTPSAKGGDLVNMLGLFDDQMPEPNARTLKPGPGLPALEVTVDYTKNASARNNLVVFDDSFGHALEPYLGYDFAKVDYFRQYFLDGNKIDQERPVAVVSEMVERHVDSDDPVVLMGKDQLK